MVWNLKVKTKKFALQDLLKKDAYIWQISQLKTLTTNDKFNTGTASINSMNETFLYFKKHKVIGPLFFHNKHPNNTKRNILIGVINKNIGGIKGRTIKIRRNINQVSPFNGKVFINHEYKLHKGEDYF